MSAAIGGAKKADGMNLDLTDITWFTVRSKFAAGKLA